MDCKTILQTGTKPGRSDFLGGRFSWWDGWYTLANGNFPLTHAVTHEQKNRGGNSGTERIYGYGNPAANPLNTTESPRKASLSNLRRNRHNVYQAVTRTEMLKILGFRFLALADDINDRSTLTATAFIGVVFLSHSCHKPSPPINGIAPKHTNSVRMLMSKSHSVTARRIISCILFPQMTGTCRKRKTPTSGSWKS